MSVKGFKYTTMPISEFLTCYVDDTSDAKRLYFMGVLKNNKKVPIPKWLFLQIEDRDHLRNVVLRIEDEKKLASQET